MENFDPDEKNHALERTKFQLRASGAKRESSNPLGTGIHDRGYLPHVKREGASYFVTFRLADSLPQEVLAKLEQAKAARLQRLHAGKRRGIPVADSEADIASETIPCRPAYASAPKTGLGAARTVQRRSAGFQACCIAGFQTCGAFRGA